MKQSKAKQSQNPINSWQATTASFYNSKQNSGILKMSLKTQGLTLARQTL
jgi:hypothetical protein